MTGPDHYRAAELDLEAAARASDKRNQLDVAYWLGSAQVHAALALTAAMARPLFGDYSSARQEWKEAIS